MSNQQGRRDELNFLGHSGCSTRNPPKILTVGSLLVDVLKIVRLLFSGLQYFMLFFIFVLFCDILSI